MTKNFTLQRDNRNFTEGNCYLISQPRKLNNLHTKYK